MAAVSEEKNLSSVIASVLCNTNLSKKDKLDRVLSKLAIHFKSKEVEQVINIEDPVITDTIEIRKYDVIKIEVGPGKHYSIVYKVDTELKIAWVVPITSDLTIGNIIPIKGSRLFNTFYCSQFVPVFLDKNCHKFCNIFDSKKDFDKAIHIIKNYYKKFLRI